MNIEITPAIAATRHATQWSSLNQRLGSPAVSVHYAVSFLNSWEDTSKKPCADLPAQLLSVLPNVRSLKLVATDAAGTSRAASLDLQQILTTQPQSTWPIELAGEDPALRQARRACWPSITISRTDRTEHEVWLLAGLARRPFRGGFAWCAQLVNGERTRLLVVDPADPKRLVDHALVISSWESGTYDPKPSGQHILLNRIGRHYPGYLFGHNFIDPMTDVFLARQYKQWEWFDVQSAEVANWIATHVTQSPQGLSLTLEDTPRLDVRDYRDDKAGKPRNVLG